MLKGERVALEVLEGFFGSKRTRFTQKALSEKLGISLGLVNRKVAELEAIGALERAGRGFNLEDAGKLLAFFATKRRLEKDIIWRAHVKEGVRQIERGMPAGAIFTGCSAYRLRFNDAPADYGKVYAYAEGAAEIEARFPGKKGEPNLYLLKKPAWLSGKTVPVSLMYADLWNMGDWYAQEYLKALEKKLFGE